MLFLFVLFRTSLWPNIHHPLPHPTSALFSLSYFFCCLCLPLVFFFFMRSPICHSKIFLPLLLFFWPFLLLDIAVYALRAFSLASLSLSHAYFPTKRRPVFVFCLSLFFWLTRSLFLSAVCVLYLCELNVRVCVRCIYVFVFCIFTVKDKLMNDFLLCADFPTCGSDGW